MQIKFIRFSKNIIFFEWWKNFREVLLESFILLFAFIKHLTTLNNAVIEMISRICLHNRFMMFSLCLFSCVHLLRINSLNSCRGGLYELKNEFPIYFYFSFCALIFKILFKTYIYFFTSFEYCLQKSKKHWIHPLVQFFTKFIMFILVR